jgi:hypothetical protein
VVSEIMYNPAGSDDTEFIELRNIGPLPLNLTNVRFTKGIDFDFLPGTELLPGDSLLVVKNVTAFEALYGAGLPIAGEYQFEEESSLSNEGERIKLAFGALAIHEFEYDDQAPWPDAADGGGYSLVLAHTSSNAGVNPLDPLGHGIASNWRTSAFPAGTPGSGNSQSFNGADPAADDDQDGLSAFLEHALGSADQDPNQGPGLFSAGVNEDSLTFSFRRNLLADDVAYGIEVSSDLVNWTDAVGRLVETPIGDGTSTVTFISDATISARSRLFMRLRVQQVTALP